MKWNERRASLFGEVGSVAQKIWQDQRGVVISIELILVMTIVVIGLLAGLSAYRDAMVSEVNDAAEAVSELNQSYSYDSINLTGTFGDIDYDTTVDGSQYTDNSDLGDHVDLQIDGTTLRDEGVQL